MVDLLTVSKDRKEAIERLAREFRAGRSVVMSTHINADGDGCGSEAALARILDRVCGMTVKIVNPTPWPETYEFLLGEDVDGCIGEGSSALKKADLLIVLDISDVKRLGSSRRHGSSAQDPEACDRSSHPER